MRSGHRRFIIIIITTTPFEVEGREVGCPTVYEVYMVRYIVGFCVSNNHLSWGHEVGSLTVYEVYMVWYIFGFFVSNNHLSWGS